MSVLVIFKIRVLSFYNIILPRCLNARYFMKKIVCVEVFIKFLIIYEENFNIIWKKI